MPLAADEYPLFNLLVDSRVQFGCTKIMLKMFGRRVTYYAFSLFFLVSGNECELPSEGQLHDNCLCRWNNPSVEKLTAARMLIGGPSSWSVERVGVYNTSRGIASVVELNSLCLYHPYGMD